jgi:nitronate monooxygenase
VDADGPLGRLGLAHPVLAAPMAGGPTTPAMVVAAARSGSLGFLAGGYRSAGQLAGDVAEVRAAGVGFGVNLFAPGPVPVDPGAYRRYADALQVDADVYGLDLRASSPVEDDDAWTAKLRLLLADPVPVVSFTFAVPDAAVVAALRAAGTVTVQTVTSVDEAHLAAAGGVDVLAVQGPGAGGHSATMHPDRPADPVPLPVLVGRVTAAVGLPVIAAGGLAVPGDVAAVLAAGAAAVMVGTVLLRTDESGASAPYRAALADGGGRLTIVTRAFSGRPARALPNALTDRYDAIAPSGYPAVHHLTSPLRRAAAAAGDAGRINLWAGTGYRHAGEGPAAGVLRRLAGLG